MNTIKTIMTTAAAMVLVFTAQSASAEASAFTPGTATTLSSEAAEWTYTSSDGVFVADDFTFTISPQVLFDAAEDASTASVGAGSVRGKRIFTGTTAGGSVKDCGDPFEDTPIAGSDVTGAISLTLENGCAAGGS